MRTLEIIKPDDWHLHLRDGDMLDAVAPISAQQFGRAIIMPNLKPPITTSKQAAAYRARIMQAANAPDFSALMTLFMSDQIDAQDLKASWQDGLIHAVKLYPQGATTNAAAGVDDFDKIMPIIALMSEEQIPLLIHGELADDAIDIFDREAQFITSTLIPLRARFPDLRIILEHITTKEAVDFIMSQPNNTAATITPHHLVINRNALFKGGLRPHNYCLPIAKREIHRQALIKAATSGDPRFFMGSDSAPHTVADKQSDCGCAGIFCAPNAIAVCAQVFDNANALDKLEGFLSRHGAQFYKMPPNNQKIQLTKRETPITPSNTQLATKLGPVQIFVPPIAIHWQYRENNPCHMTNNQ